MRPFSSILSSVLFTLAFCAAGPSDAAATDATVRGKVLDSSNAMTLPGAPVAVLGTDTVIYTDLDGVYRVELPPGRHQLEVSFSGYAQRVIEVTVPAKGTVTADVTLDLETVKLSEEITVSAQAEAAPATQAAAMLERKKSSVISEAMARDEMSKNADSDAAAALTRVTGVSVVDGQYVFVRGLGERYSNTTLNGSVLPTTEPDRRVVPLDLFPTGLVEQVRIVKSYLPDKPAEFSGGLLEIEPINFPRAPTFSVSVNGGWNSRATFKDISRSAGAGSTDWLGFDDGGRSLPSVIPDSKLVERGILGTGFSFEELTRFGRSFDNAWRPVPVEGRPDAGFSILAGNSWDRLGAVASVTYSYKNRFRRERQQFYALGQGGEGLRPTNDFDFRYSTARATLGAVANVAYRFSGNHRLALENFYTNSGRDEARTFEGYQEDKGVPLRNQRLFWLQESVLSSKLSSEHFFPGLSHSRFDWHFTYSRADRDEPDVREVLYQYDPIQDAYVWANESQSGFRMFSELDDSTYDGAVDWSAFFNVGGRFVTVKAGGGWTYRDRFFSSRRLRFKPLDIGGVDLTQPAEALFRQDNIGTVFRFEEDTRRTDRYDAEQTILAGYLMGDFNLTGRLRFVGGARVESSDQAVITRDLFDPTLPSIRSSLRNADVLPGINLIYALGGDTNLRLGLSQTVNRPEFRELAPYEFTDIVGGRAVVGNPDLERALIRNGDLRWEWFPRGGVDGEVVAVSAFFKDFVSPIEKVVQATAQFRTSFANALGARNYGFELEARKSLLPAVLVGVNYTFVESRIELERGAGQIQTSLDRPLAGQSAHVLNTMVELRDASRDLSGRVLFNWSDDRISEVGALGIPDILEEGRASLDVVLTRRFGPYALRLAGENLTDSEHRFTQGGLLQRAFALGRSVGLSLSYTR
jgi:hypothetical protein